MASNTYASKNSSWEAVNWDALRRLRARFLEFGGGNAGGAANYWRNWSELESYDLTFAERIGWKWDAVLEELTRRRWSLPAGPVLDFGCGTGVAGRRVAAWARDGGGGLAKLLLWDRSQAAMEFALRRAEAAFPGLPVETARLDKSQPDPGFGTLLVSHVLNELSPEGLDRLLAVAERAQAILWVEPGTAAVSRRLISVRERLLPAFRPFAPCPHAVACGLLAPENERHWCHHFATTPAAVFQDSGWSRFAHLLEIDLGTTPFSWLVLDRRTDLPEEANTSRILGEPRHYKGFSKILSCQEDGVRDLILQKRDAPDLARELRKEPGSLYRWVREGTWIRGGTRI